MNARTIVGGWVVVVVGTLGTMAAVEPRERESRVQEYFRKFPEADLNRDGALTAAEAREHQRARKEGRRSRVVGEGEKSRRVEPTHANVAYGPHSRNVLDFWRAAGPAATPVLVFFHGGSFKAGDKSNVLARPIFSECLQAGISVVSVNYRYSTDAPFPAPMRDGARAVQYVRTRAAEWGVDPERVAVSGSSAGATLALWIALHDDLADRASTDPIARESTRVVCATPHSGTAGLSADYFRQHAGATKLGAALFQLFGVRTQAEFAGDALRPLVREASPLTHVSADDPPLMLTYAGEPAEAPFPADAAQSAWIHHVSLGLPLKARYDELGLECELHHRGRPAAAGAEVAFLRRHLFGSR